MIGVDAAIELPFSAPSSGRREQDPVSKKRWLAIGVTYVWSRFHRATIRYPSCRLPMIPGMEVALQAFLGVGIHGLLELVRVKLPLL